MKAKISALMDGELERHETGGAIDALDREGEALETWRTYHLIGDAMRDTRLLKPGFASRVSAKLAEEPTVLAPRAKPLLEQRRWQVLSAAASIAAVGFVSMAFFSQEPNAPQAPVATVAPAEATATAQVAPPEAASEYLLAHQVYSPRNSLQGVAPYVRTVSTDARGTRR
jgi:sigma-E factor negative regulatory protein RseA